MDMGIWARWDGTWQVPGRFEEWEESSRTVSGEEPRRSQRGWWAVVRPLFFTLSEMGASECSGQDWTVIRVIYRIPPAAAWWKAQGKQGWRQVACLRKWRFKVCSSTACVCGDDGVRGVRAAPGPDKTGRSWLLPHSFR